MLSPTAERATYPAASGARGERAIEPEALAQQLSLAELELDSLRQGHAQWGGLEGLWRCRAAAARVRAIEKQLRGEFES